MRRFYLIFFISLIVSSCNNKERIIIDGQYSEGKIIFESLLNNASVSNEIKIRAEKYINIIN